MNDDADELHNAADILSQVSFIAVERADSIGKKIESSNEFERILESAGMEFRQLSIGVIVAFIGICALIVSVIIVVVLGGMRNHAEFVRKLDQILTADREVC